MDGPTNGPTTGPKWDVCPAAKPSANVGPGISTFTGCPAAMAADIDGQRSGSTPRICTLGLMVLTARAMPAIREASIHTTTTTTTTTTI